jgi:manganese/iron transport system substrate-binding protein
MPLNLPVKSTLNSRKNFKVYSLVAVIAIATGLTACTVTEANKPISTATATSPAAKTEDLPLVVATNSVSCGLAQQIAGDTINLKCLIEAGVDPHVYQSNPEDRKAIDSAKLILYGGYNFEPSVIKLIKASSNPAPRVAVNEIAVPTPLMAEDGRDPHVWHNAQNGIKITQSISKSLIVLRPDQAETYTKNTAKLINELEQVDTWIKAQIATIPEASRKLVTTHDALGYYAAAYGIPIEGALNGISTDEQPTPTRVKELVNEIKSSKVPTIFAEVAINPKLINTVAKEATVKVSEHELYADGLGLKGSEAETYVGMLIANTRTIVEGLGGKYTPFQLRN